VFRFQPVKVADLRAVEAGRMQRTWSVGELSERWSLLPEDLALLAGRIDAGKLGFAVQLAFWRQHGRFPTRRRT